jgi:hypothetical protein
VVPVLPRRARRSFLGWLQARVVGVLAAAVALLGFWAVPSAPVASASSPCGTAGSFSAPGPTYSCTYTMAGMEDTFAVPTGVTSVAVSAVGAPGGDSPGGASGGMDAVVVNGALPVTPGSPLWVDVGAAGSPGLASAPEPPCLSAVGGAFDGGTSDSLLEGGDKGPQVRGLSPEGVAAAPRQC